jgi:hypothetical protein
MTGQWQGTAAEWDRQLAMVMRDQPCDQDTAVRILPTHIGPRPGPVQAPPRTVRSTTTYLSFMRWTPSWT